MSEKFTIQTSIARGRRSTTININPAYTASLIEHLRGRTYDVFHVTLHSGEWVDKGHFDSVTLFGNDGERAASSFQIPED